jgi:hypothetical protein
MNTWKALRPQQSPCVFVSSINPGRQLPAAADYTGICLANRLAIKSLKPGKFS